jgi:NTE family protein
MKPLKILCSGGGIPGVLVLAGAVREVMRQGHSVAEIAGVSAGALVAAVTAAGYDAEAVALKIFGQAAPLERLDPFPLGPFPFLYKGDRTLAVLRKLLPARMDDFDIPLHVVTADLTTRRQAIWSSRHHGGQDPARLVRASMSIPGVFPPVKIAGHLHVDGGLTSNFPIDEIWPGQRDVLGLLVQHRSEDRPTVEVTNLAGYLAAIVNTAIASNVREDLADTAGANVCYVKAFGDTLNWNIDRASCESLIETGRLCARDWSRSEQRRARLLVASAAEVGRATAAGMKTDQSKE